MVTNHMLKIIVLSFLIDVNGIPNLEANNYGSYDIRWVKFDTCKRPKPPCGKVTTTNFQNMSDLIYLMDMKRDCPVEMVRIVVSVRDESSNKTRKLWNYLIQKPCQHFLIGPVLSIYFKGLTQNNCKILQGHYEYHLDLHRITKMFFGPKFFYGVYMTKTLVQNKSCFLACYESELVIEKS